MTTVVTGAASGIGAAVADRLRRAGDEVIGIDRHSASITVNLGTPGERDRAIEEVADRSGGKLNGLVTFAGVGPTDRAPSELISVNYFGTVRLLEELRPLLARGTNASAVAASSNTVTCHPHPVPSELVNLCLEGDEEKACRVADERFKSAITYAATKVAVSRWVRQHAVEPKWAQANIRLNAVAPGMVDTAMVAERRRDPALAPATDPSTVPIGRAAQPEEIAAFVTFLLGPEARFFCGSVLVCDGGNDAMLNHETFPEFSYH